MIVWLGPEKVAVIISLKSFFLWKQGNKNTFLFLLHNINGQNNLMYCFRKFMANGSHSTLIVYLILFSAPKVQGTLEQSKSCCIYRLCTQSCTSESRQEIYKMDEKGEIIPVHITVKI